MLLCSLFYSFVSLHGNLIKLQMLNPKPSSSLSLGKCKSWIYVYNIIKSYFMPKKKICACMYFLTFLQNRTLSTLSILFSFCKIIMGSSLWNWHETKAELFWNLSFIQTFGSWTFQKRKEIECYTKLLVDYANWSSFRLGNGHGHGLRKNTKKFQTCRLVHTYKIFWLRFHRLLTVGNSACRF